MAPHSSVLAWRIPWKEEPGGLQSMGLERVRHPHYRLGSGGEVGIEHQGGHRSYNDDHLSYRWRKQDIFRVSAEKGPQT